MAIITKAPPEIDSDGHLLLHLLLHVREQRYFFVSRGGGGGGASTLKREGKALQKLRLHTVYPFEDPTTCPACLPAYQL